MSGGHIRLRPLKQFRFLIAYGPFKKGDVFQPTGVYRSTLLAKKIIEEVPEAPPEAVALPLANMAEPEIEEQPAAEELAELGLDLPLEQLREPGRRRRGGR